MHTIDWDARKYTVFPATQYVSRRVTELDEKWRHEKKHNVTGEECLTRKTNMITSPLTKGMKTYQHPSEWILKRMESDGLRFMDKAEI